jgi:diguanylate cyclase (GGDEF)-like protein
VVALSLDEFQAVGTIVFVLLSVIVSTLLGRVLEASNRRVFMLELEQHRDARTDPLTGLANRRAIQERGRNDAKLARRTGRPLSLVLADFDQFKNINDRYGHEAGDAVLVKTAALLRDQLRDSDAVGRWGGEEFVVLLPATDAEGAHGVAERIRIAIARARFDGIAEAQTISLGVATSQGLDDPSLEWDLLIKEADQRLYRAKHEGRNRVVSA